MPGISKPQACYVARDNFRRSVGLIIGINGVFPPEQDLHAGVAGICPRRNRQGVVHFTTVITEDNGFGTITGGNGVGFYTCFYGQWTRNVDAVAITEADG